MLQLVCPVSGEPIGLDVGMTARALAPVWNKSVCLRCRKRCRNCRTSKMRNFKIRDAYMEYVLALFGHGLR